MPSPVDSARVNAINPAADRRRVLTPEQREAIRAAVLETGAGINQTARERWNR